MFRTKYTRAIRAENISEIWHNTNKYNKQARYSQIIWIKVMRWAWGLGTFSSPGMIYCMYCGKQFHIYIFFFSREREELEQKCSMDMDMDIRGKYKNIHFIFEIVFSLFVFHRTISRSIRISHTKRGFTHKTNDDVKKMNQKWIVYVREGFSWYNSNQRNRPDSTDFTPVREICQYYHFHIPMRIFQCN